MSPSEVLACWIAVAGRLHAGAEEGELENKLLRSWEDLTRGNALACWCEERMQELASAYERDVLKVVRRCIHSVNGKGNVHVSDGGYCLHYMICDLRVTLPSWTLSHYIYIFSSPFPSITTPL
jgi:hypothetical protein